MEKVINEIKIVETDDGFRIEIRGTKKPSARCYMALGPGFPLGTASVSASAPVFGAALADGVALGRKQPKRRKGSEQRE